MGSYTYAQTGYANPHAVTSWDGNTYTYDADGNVSNYQTWDPWNRLSTFNNDGTVSTYTYDSSGQRLTQQVGTKATTTYWNSYYETTGATTTLYIFAGGQLLATVEGNGSATSTYIAHTDHLGSTAVMSDKNGSSTQVSSYYPFGTKRVNDLPSNGFVEKRGFIGQYEDTATQLSYLNARYYDGGRGQFLSQDSLFRGDPNGQRLVNPQELNSYSYAWKKWNRGSKRAPAFLVEG